MVKSVSLTLGFQENVCLEAKNNYKTLHIDGFQITMPPNCDYALDWSRIVAWEINREVEFEDTTEKKLLASISDYYTNQSPNECVLSCAITEYGCTNPFSSEYIDFDGNQILTQRNLRYIVEMCFSCHFPGDSFREVEQTMILKLTQFSDCSDSMSAT